MLVDCDHVWVVAGARRVRRGTGPVPPTGRRAAHFGEIFRRFREMVWAMMMAGERPAGLNTCCQRDQYGWLTGRTLSGDEGQLYRTATLQRPENPGTKHSPNKLLWSSCGLKRGRVGRCEVQHI